MTNKLHINTESTANNCVLNQTITFHGAGEESITGLICYDEVIAYIDRAERVLYRKRHIDAGQEQKAFDKWESVWQPLFDEVKEHRTDTQKLFEAAVLRVLSSNEKERS